MDLREEYEAAWLEDQRDQYYESPFGSRERALDEMHDQSDDEPDDDADKET